MEASPAEACGIITPDSRVVELPNSHPTSPEDAFVITTEDLIDAIYDYVDRTNTDPETLDRSQFVVWHTHPSGLIGPSRGDLRAKIEGFRYLVVTLPGGEATFF